MGSYKSITLSFITRYMNKLWKNYGKICGPGIPIDKL